MKIQVNTASSIDGSDDLTAMIESTVHAALDRYGDRLTRVEVHVSDQDGAAGDKRAGKQCLLEARPSGLDPVVVTGSGDTVDHACHDATHKMERLLDSTFGRIDARDGNATIRQNRK